MKKAIFREETKGSGVIDCAHLAIKDSRPRYSSDQMEYLFSPFISSKKSRGTGLGLPVSQKILQEHGGRIEVHSDPGEGCRFTLEFPATLPPSGSETFVGKRKE